MESTNSSEYAHIGYMKVQEQKRKKYSKYSKVYSKFNVTDQLGFIHLGLNFII